MKILYVSQYFPPEMGAPAARAAELAQHWSQFGHQVSILTGFPNHPTGIVPPEWRSRLRRLTYHEKIDHVDVFRTWLWPLPNRKAHERMRNYASFCFSAALRGMSLPQPDVVIATSPQLLVGLAGWWLARLKKIPFVFEVRDLWPESLSAVGAAGDNSLLHRSLSRIANFLYKNSDRIVVVTSAFKDNLVKHRHVPAEKIFVVENGVETGVFRPSSPETRTTTRHQLRVEGKFLISYVGTVGMAHGLETLLDAADSLQHQNPAVTFLVLGEGSEKERIESLAAGRGLKNIVFVGQQPRERIPEFISASDACLVLLKKNDVFKTVIPTKMLEFMSCARPVILGVDGQAREIVEGAQSGIAVEPENSADLAAAIDRLAAHPELGRALGQNGRDYIIKHFSRRTTAEKYITVLEALLLLDRARGKIAA